MIAMQIANKYILKRVSQWIKIKLECLTLLGRECIEMFSKRALRASLNVVKEVEHINE